MALYIVIDIMLRFIVHSETLGERELSRPFILQQHSLHGKVVPIRLKWPHRLAAFSPGIAMPRLRGTPRRGAP